MKGIFLAIALMLAADGTQTLTQEERDHAVAELEGSRRAFLDATKGLSTAQWSFSRRRNAGRLRSARSILRWRKDSFSAWSANGS